MKRLGVALLALSLLGAAPPPLYGEMVASFWDRNLTATHLYLETLLARGAFDEAAGNPAHLWHEVLDLVECVPLTPVQTATRTPQNSWEILVGLVRLERLRLRRAQYAGEPVGLWHDLRAPSFFSYPSLEMEEGWVEWPAEQEIWPDEYPRIHRPEPQCVPGERPDPATLARWLEEELAHGSVLIAALPEDHPARPALLLHQAALLIRTGRMDRALTVAAPLFAAPPASLSPAERAQAALLRAMDLERQGEASAALDLYRELADAPSLVQVRPFLASRIQAALLAEHRFDELLETLPLSPDLETATGRYQAYLRGRVLLEQEQYGALLDHTRWVLRRVRHPERDQALRALIDLAYGYLAAAPFDDRIVELIEGIGPPRGLFLRLERFSQVAEEQGKLDNARAALRWLLAHHHVARNHHRYRARLAEVAFTKADLPAFRRELRRLTDRSDQLDRAIPTTSRGRFWAEQDRQLLYLTRSLLPRLAERGEDRWARPLVLTLQQFLRRAPESRYLDQLTELYRTARSLLDRGPRAYAEKVGATRLPLVLGEVCVDRPLPEPPPPRPPVRIDEPHYLLRLPAGAAPEPLRPWFTEEAP